MANEIEYYKIIEVYELDSITFVMEKISKDEFEYLPLFGEFSFNLLNDDDFTEEELKKEMQKFSQGKTIAFCEISKENFLEISQNLPDWILHPKEVKGYAIKRNLN